ncbi:MAG TPA: hypothetical protein VK335_14550 [Bryobacteraceae bacterium]|nr:hypothetical protein [Bryobacteraceae bacterium]
MKVTTVLVALAIPLAAFAQSNPLTARQVIERIQKNVGVPWRAETVDTFKAGDPDTPVTGSDHDDGHLRCAAPRRRLREQPHHHA